ncbi:ABC transporter permease [Rhodomicrobium lacus]|uniref:ABC transporter permease n=1 Tax=Rhodomicrobium lacus TaxID=2498452 RepID=UPI0026E19798|nr:ABC transporter permease subunit [Rhodomicrobium lacus]WKW49791.1 ABC transporter permease subunit [Rhodomicrobium lacus]
MINWSLFERFGTRMVEGFAVTLELAFGSALLGLLIAAPVALGRAYGGRVLSGALFGYTYVMRGTPLLAQLFLVYYGSAQFQASLDAAGLWWLFRDPFYCSLLTFTLHTAAYQAEILAGAVRAVPRGQVEAAKAAAMPPALVARRIVLPQAARLALRPLGNELILMVKASALASVVTVYDLLATAKLAFQRTYDFQAYIAAALVYVLTVEIIRRIWNALDRRLNRHLVRA